MCITAFLSDSPDVLRGLVAGMRYWKETDVVIESCWAEGWVLLHDDSNDEPNVTYRVAPDGSLVFEHDGVEV